jgi:glycine betaine/proline transport system ATP-binding protein
MCIRDRTDTPLSELFAPTSNARVPLAVVDEDFHLMGVISRVTLLDAMSRARDEAGEGSVMSLENTGKLPIIRDTGNPVGLPPADQIATIEKEA